MTEPERRFFQRVHRKTSTLTPELAAAILRAFQAIAATLSERELTTLIAQGAFDRLITDVLGEDVLSIAFRPVQRRLRSTLEQATTYHARDIPPSPAATRTVSIGFDVLDPAVQDAIRTLETKVIRTLKEDVRETVRQAISAGIDAGQSPLVIARSIRDVVGLSPQQELAVRNYRAELERGAVKAAESRQLHDARFKVTDSLSPEKIDRMVSVYRKNMVAFHAETVARTGTLDAFKAGQALAWQQAIDDGIVDGNRLRRTWVTVGDDRVRDEHRAMQGETVGFTESFSNGEYTPGSSTFNCRCLARITLARAA